VSVGREAQPSFRLPLFDGTYDTFDAVLASIYKVFFVLDDLANIPYEAHIVAHHGI
jgi:hypothetical protein